LFSNSHQRQAKLHFEIFGVDLTQQHRSNTRARVADEAATLLYARQEKEYKQAKLKAAKTLGVRILPSNTDIAEALDRLAEEREGEERRKELVTMREEALRIMKTLRKSHPVLTGSVWRGTARRGSDIDIAVFSDAPEKVQVELEKAGYKITKTEFQTVTKRGMKLLTFHIHLLLLPNHEVEVVVRGLERMNVKEPCEIYGDVQTGLSTVQLEQVMRTNPIQKFTPNSAQ
jgi:predicted nucleotidyltransferase